MTCTKTSHRFIIATVACLGAIASSSAFAQYNAEVGRWQTQDLIDAPAQGGIVFVGSSSIRRWEALTRDFNDYNVIQRGLGGATFNDINPNINKIVLPYNPKAVVVWAGTNDIASGTSGADVYARYQTFANTVLAAKPDTDIFYLGIMPTPGRQSNRPQEDIANSSIAAFSAGNPRLHYIDLPTAFAPLNPYSGTAFTSKFVDDIHLNKGGYNFWTSIIRPQIEAVVAPMKVYTPNPKAMKLGEHMLFDFGPGDGTNGEATASPDSRGHYWNNWFSVAGGSTILPGEHKANMITTAGRSTGTDLTITGQFQVNGKLNGGLLSPSTALLGDFGIATATQDYFFSSADDKQGGGDDDTNGGFMLDGLDPALTYSFRFFGSRDTTETRISEYRMYGANTDAVQLTTSGNNIGADGVYDGNNTTIATVNRIRPDRFGQVWFDMTMIQGAFAHINAMEVIATPEPTSMLALGSAILVMTRRQKRSS